MLDSYVRWNYLYFVQNCSFKCSVFPRDLSPSCDSFAVPSLCYSTFALCREEDVDPSGSSEHWSKVASREPRRICRDDCEILENEMCRMEYAIAKRHPLIGQQLALPECGDLPAIGSPDSENCLKLGIPRPENVEPGNSLWFSLGFQSKCQDSTLN